MKTVTICGSMRFSDEMKHIAFQLEAYHGFNVLQCVYTPFGTTICGKELELLVQAHKCKIDLSDAIYVVDINGYIGDAVRSEIEYAKGVGKELIFHSQFEL